MCFLLVAAMEFADVIFKLLRVQLVISTETIWLIVD